MQTLQGDNRAMWQRMNAVLPQKRSSLMLESDGINAPPTISHNAVPKAPMRVGRWQPAEHSLFVNGITLYGKQWKRVADLVKTRTITQVRTHAQKFFKKNPEMEKICRAATPKALMLNDGNKSNEGLSGLVLGGDDNRLSYEPSLLQIEIPDKSYMGESTPSPTSVMDMGGPVPLQGLIDDISWGDSSSDLNVEDFLNESFLAPERKRMRFSADSLPGALDPDAFVEDILSL